MVIGSMDGEAPAPGQRCHRMFSALVHSTPKGVNDAPHTPTRADTDKIGATAKFGALLTIPARCYGRIATVKFKALLAILGSWPTPVRARQSV
jgi:hypothetical protein